MTSEFKGQYQSDKALSCPFCGEAPILVPWHGGGRKKRNLMCRNEDCPVKPSVCASTEAKAIAAWNTRVGGKQEGVDAALGEPKASEHLSSERRRGLEEAAKIAEAWGKPSTNARLVGGLIAKAIRALIPPSSEEGEEKT